MTKRHKLSFKDRAELEKLIAKQHYRVSNIVDMTKRCKCGTMRGYVQDGKTICLGCQTSQGKRGQDGVIA